MAISAIENHTKVRTPSGHEGRVRVTRRERKLISDGKQDIVDVVFPNGSTVGCYIDQLEIVEDTPAEPDTAETMQTAFNNAIDFAIDDSDGDGIVFLTLWREGCWPEIREEFPEFIEKYGAPE